MSAVQLDLFNSYSAAVNATRYRVTAIKMVDGGQRAFILYNRNDGFIPGEIPSLMPELIRLQTRGENIYYTPLSVSRHHILVDDISRPKLEHLIRDGYQPAALLETSPDNFQSIITFQKLGSTHDREIANKITADLNQQYGDPRLSGAIHAHRAPGFKNRKPKHRREDGTYPLVKLRKAAQRECPKTYELSQIINADMQKQRTRIGFKHQFEAGVGVDTSTAYYRHYNDIIQRQGGSIDYSVLDYMIAERLFITGHSQDAIEAALINCASTIRTDKTSHNWSDYAHRTASRAMISPHLPDLTKRRSIWRRLEENKN